MNKSRDPVTMVDLTFLLIFVAFFSLVIISFATPKVHFFFESTGLGQSLFSLTSGVVILFYGIVWGSWKIADQIKATKTNKEVWQTTWSRASSFIGFAKLTQTKLSHILLSMLVGAAFNTLISYGVTIWKGGNMFLAMPPPRIDLLFQYLVVAPLFEEFVYRGIYLGAFMRILGTDYPSAALGLTLSSFTFGWIHTDPIPSLLIKTAGGFMFGIIYMIKWKKNYPAAVSAHLGVNLVGIFLNVELPN